MPTMIQRRIRRLEAIDRRHTAVHEAGHVVIATELQIQHSDRAEEDRWNGFTKAQLDSLPQPKKAMFGVAGRVAEACWKKHALEEIYWDDPDIMSPSDWDAVACEPGRPNDCLEEAAKQVFNLLNRESGRLWPSLIREARVFILRSRQISFLPPRRE